MTHTRIWEFALGGLLAVWTPSLGEGARRLLGIAGLAAIAAAALVYSHETAFPGHAALVPTMGAVFVILSGATESRLSVHSLLSTRPFQFVGNTSYSIYLWHWPLIVFFRREAGDDIGLMAGALILTATVALSALSTREIEDRFRHPQPERPLRSKGALFGLVLGAPLIVCATVGVHIARTAAHTPLDITTSPEGLRTSDPPSTSNIPTAHRRRGRAAIPVSAIDRYSPPLALVKLDHAAVYDNGCHLTVDDIEPVACRYGNPHGPFKAFLVGDSHAANWVPAFEKVAERQGWNAASYTKSSCALISIMVDRNDTRKPNEACFQWGRRMLEVISAERPDVVILAQAGDIEATPGGGDGLQPSVHEGLASTWRALAELGARVVAIADTPMWTKDPDACLAKDPQCAVPLRSISLDDPVFGAHERQPSVALIDFNDIVCPRGRCPVVIDNIIVWRDRHHLTATYSRSLANVFGQRIDEVLQGGETVHTAHSEH
jgi:hypothetical protein